MVPVRVTGNPVREDREECGQDGCIIKSNIFTMSRKIVALVLVTSLSILLLNAQEKTPVRIYGQVLSYKDNQPLSFASIVNKNTGKGTVARESGFFELEVPSDTSTLVVSYVGFKTKEVKLSPVRISGTLFIKMEEALQQLDEVTVAVEKERIIRVSDNQISAVKISPQMIAKLPNLGEVDVLRSFQLLPGVSASNETSAGLYVRGGTPDQNLILFDGMTIYHVDHFYGFFSAFNANTIDDIELIKGGFPAKYGGRTSSVMEITGKPADYQEINGGGSLSLLSANAYLEVPVIKDKLSWQLAARRSYTDLIRTGLYNKIFDLYSEEDQATGFGGPGRFQQTSFEPSFHFYDVNSKLSYQLNEKNQFFLSFYNGKDELDNSRELSAGGFRMTADSDGEIIDVAGWGNLGTSARWESKWSDQFSSNVFLSWSNYFSTRDRQTSITPGTQGAARPGMNTFENNKVQDFSLRFRNKWELSDNNVLEFGFEHSYIDISYSLVFNDTVPMVDRIDKGNQSSFYLQDRIRLFDRLNVSAGIRSTYFDVTAKTYFEPRASVVLEPFENFKLKAAWGIYNQYLARIIREDVQQGSKDFWLLADDENVPVVNSVHYIAGASYEKNNFYFDTEFFYKELTGLTEYSMRYTGSPGPRNNAGAQEDYFYNGTGYVKGAEFLIQKKYGKNTGWIAYTLSEVMHHFPDLNYGNQYYALHDQTHEFKTVYTRTIKHWDLSAAFIYATGKPYSAPESEYQLTLLNGDVYNYIHVSDKNSYRLPDYHRLDLSASYNWKSRKTSQTISLSVFNLYNRKNVWYKEFEIEENQVYITDVTLLGTTPNISFRINF